MNLWVLFLCRFFIQSRVKRSKVILTALLTALGEVLLLCIPVGNSGIKIIFGFGGVMAFSIYWLFRPKSRKFFCKLMIYSYFVMFVLGGFLIFVECFWIKKEISMISWSITVVLLVILIEIIFHYINKKSEVYQVVLTVAQDRKCQVTALMDSGNGLVEPISKMPVSVVEEAIIEPYKEWLKEDKFRIVPFHSVGKNNGLLEAYFIEKIEIINEGENRIIDQPIIAITKDSISGNRNYQMILHPALLEQGGINSDF